jgi:hypothetical protein
LTYLKVLPKSKFSLRTQSSLAGGQIGAEEGHVRMSTPSSSLRRERDNAWDTPLEPSARSICVLSEMAARSQHSTDGSPFSFMTNAVTRDFAPRGSSKEARQPVFCHRTHVYQSTCPPWDDVDEPFISDRGRAKAAGTNSKDEIIEIVNLMMMIVLDGK